MLGRWSAWLVAVSLIASSCVLPSDPTSGIGAMLDGDEMRLFFNLCPGERVMRVEVRSSGNIPESEVKVIWSIESDSGEPLTELVVGSIPEGFDEVSPLQDVEFQRLEAVGVSADFGDIEPVTTIWADELEAGMVTLAGRSYTPAEFFALDCNY